MKKRRRYDRVLSFGATDAQIKKLEKISELVGQSVSNVVRGLVDSAIPDIDPNDRFWQACKNSGIFNIDVPAQTVTAFIASFLELPLTGNDEIDNIKIRQNPPHGLSPILWALQNIKEEIYDKSLPLGTDKQDESEDAPEEQGGTPSDQ